MSSSNLPDYVFDEKGNRYLVVKPHNPDPDMWVRLIAKNESKKKLPAAKK